MMRTEQLKLLQRLAGLRADRAAARLARVQGLIDTLEERAAKLRDAPAADMSNIANAMAQDRWEALADPEPHTDQYTDRASERRRAAATRKPRPGNGPNESS